MEDSEERLRQAEGLAGLRRGLLLVNALAYVVALGAGGLSRVGGYGFDTAQLDLARLIAWPIWFLSLLGILWTMHRAKRHPEIGALMDDERTVNLKSIGFQAGYWAILLPVAGHMTATYFTDVDIKLVLPFVLAVGVAVPPMTLRSCTGAKCVRGQITQ
jgi:hypothetical protein